MGKKHTKHASLYRCDCDKHFVSRIDLGDQVMCKSCGPGVVAVRICAVDNRLGFRRISDRIKALVESWKLVYDADVVTEIGELITQRSEV